MNDQFALGQKVKSQGGIYVGPRLIDGVVNHIFIPGGPEFDLVDIKFNDINEEIQKFAGVNDFSDWRAPSQEEMMLAYINARHLFKGKHYWTSTLCGSYLAWAIDFGNGFVNSWGRGFNFLARPVRSVKAQ